MTAETKTVPGWRNSSITRVRPFFQSLLRRDPTGGDWLPQLVSAAPKAPTEIADNPGELLPWVAETRTYADKVLKKHPYNIATIQLEKCLEKSLQPPEAFLKWLVEHPAPERWKQKRSSGMSPATLEWRDKLFGMKDEDARREAVCAALRALESRGSKGSRKQWWAFEGFTEVDCYLETDRLILLVEGKRTEHLSASTDWHEGRNQLLRNLEAIGETHGEKAFGVIAMTETPIADPTEDETIASLPHLSPQERKRLTDGYWGCVTWEQACLAAGLDFSALPDTTAQAIASMSPQQHSI